MAQTIAWDIPAENIAIEAAAAAVDDLVINAAVPTVWYQMHLKR